MEVYNIFFLQHILRSKAYITMSPWSHRNTQKKIVNLTGKLRTFWKQWWNSWTSGDYTIYNPRNWDRSDLISNRQCLSLEFSTTKQRVSLENQHKTVATQKNPNSIPKKHSERIRSETIQKIRSDISTVIERRRWSPRRTGTKIKHLTIVFSDWRVSSPRWLMIRDVNKKLNPLRFSCVKSIRTDYRFETKARLWKASSSLVKYWLILILLYMVC